MIMSLVLNSVISLRPRAGEEKNAFLFALSPSPEFPSFPKNRMPDRRFVDPQLRSSTLIKSSCLSYIFDRF